MPCADWLTIISI